MAPSCKQAQEETTYRNPIINADVPDMTLCRVGDYYYMVSTTMHLMPGGPVMRSSDMMHWETISYLFDKIEDGDRYDLIDGSAYGQGQWASSMRYHNGRFYVWFTANGAPHKGFIFSSEKAEGPWELIARPPHFHDGSLFFDDDDRVYICCEQGHLVELSADLQGVKEGGVDTVLFQRDEEEKTSLLEGSNMFKYDGRYYIMMISMDWSIPGRVRREVCYRADNIMGPYEKKVILETPFETYGGVGQGAIVDGKNGEWYGLIFQDRGGIGRVPCLMPCRWIDGWPMLGDENGKVPSDLAKAHIFQKGVYGSDDFSGDKLSLLWQWNHNPVDSAWSLTERDGYLRLHTARVVDNIFVAPNTLTQRMAGPKCTGVVKLDVSNMKDGDKAGFAAYNGDSGVLTVQRGENGGYLLTLSEEKSIFDREKNVVGNDMTVLFAVPFDSNEIYLKIDGDFTPDNDWATFSYSLDGVTWNSVGKPIKMVFDYRRMFMGSKFAIFNYATKALGGYIDVDKFDYEQYE
ncbi:MAG: glycoside hydrolase 43 family protein [Bacteroidales bacterium]|nr:glycoside hydrolase 43 family protein [Bacteroidales bacterium]